MESFPEILGYLEEKNSIFWQQSLLHSNTVIKTLISLQGSYDYKLDMQTDRMKE